MASPHPSSNLSLQSQKPTSSLGVQSRRRAPTPTSNSVLNSGPKSPSNSSSRPTTGHPSPSTPTRKYHRSRTYSSPYASDLDFSDSPPSLPNGGTHKTKQRKLSTENTSGTKLPPTRIPKVHRPPTSASSTSTQTQSQTNGSTYPNTPNGAATNSYGPNSSYSNSVTPNTLTPQTRAADVPDTYRHASLDYPRSTPSSASASASQRGLGIGIPPSTSGSSRSTFDIPRGSFGFSRSFTTGPGIGLMNETPPFPTETSMASGLSSRHPNQTQEKRAEEKKRKQEQEQDEDPPPRPSIDSEEGPYEHWYRGEVSRNGGVGELKVGRRQEMLEIANYGHMIRSQNRDRKLRKQQPLGFGGMYEDGYRDDWQGQPQHPSEWTERGQRKRAGSIGGLTNKERERGSLCLDDEDGGERVMDQEPLTDLEGEEGLESGSEEKMNVDVDRREDLESDKTQVEVDPEDADEFVVVESFAMATPRLGSQPPAQPSQTQRTPTPPYVQQTPTAKRSTTPTATPNRSTTPTSSTGRPSNSTPRTRLPSRKSSDSRSTVAGNASTTAVKVEVATMPAAGGSSSTGIGTPQQQQQQSSSSGRKRGASPGTPSSSSKKARMPTMKAKSKAPPSASKKGKENRDKEKEGGGGKVDKRTSVAMYPTVEGGEELADAIPSWMEPVSEGNWDDVSCFFFFFGFGCFFFLCIIVGMGSLDWTPLCSLKEGFVYIRQNARTWTRDQGVDLSLYNLHFVPSFLTSIDRFPRLSPLCLNT